MFNNNLLNSKIALRGMSRKSLCEKIGITARTLQNQVNKESFPSDEIARIAEVLSLTGNDIVSIFFAKFGN